MNAIAQQIAADPQIFKFGRLDRITINGTHYQLLGSHLRHHELITVKAPERCEEFTHERLYDSYSKGLLNVEKGYFSPDNARVRGEWGATTLSNLPEEKARLALFYASYMDEYIRMKASGQKGVSLSKSALEDRIIPEIGKRLQAAKPPRRSGSAMPDDFTPPAYRTFRRLLSKYIESGYQAVALVRKKTGRLRPTKFAAHDIQFWSEFAALYASRSVPTKAGLLVLLKGAAEERNPERLLKGLPLLTVPTRKYFEKMIDKLDPFFVVSRREGLKKAREKFRITYRGLEVERPMERVEMDEWKVDLQVILAHLQVWERLTHKEQAAVKRSRLWLTVAIDCASRVILAMKFSDRAPNGQSALAALEMAMIDKTEVSVAAGATRPWVGSGMIEELFADNGAGFVSLAFRAAAADLRIAYWNPPKGEASLRPFIESVFRTMSIQFLQWFEGRTFSNVIEKGDYDAEGNACICVDELNRLFVCAVVDMYHQTPHSGLGNETPHNAWLRLSRKYGVEVPPTIDERRIVFGINLKRVIGGNGILFFGLYYQHPKLQDMRVNSSVKTVNIRVNRFDISKIAVALPEGGWLIVQSTIPLEEDMSVWEWLASAQEQAFVQQQNSAPGVSVMVKTVNRLRESGAASWARSEFGVPPPDAKMIAAEERRLLQGIRFIDDLTAPPQPLSPLAIPTAPPANSLSVLQYEFKTDDEEIEPDPTHDIGDIDPDEGMAVRKQSQYGNPDDITFED